MSNPRLPTPKLRQIIQFESSELSAREVARALNLSHGAISKYRCAVRAAGVSWDEAQRLDDIELERRAQTPPGRLARLRRDPHGTEAP
jgi:IS30 family transposase